MDSFDIVKSFTDIAFKNIYCIGTLQNYTGALVDRQINKLTEACIDF